MRKFEFYCIIIKMKDVFYPIQIEYYNPFTCYIFNTGLFSIFSDFKEANKYKNIILEWKKTDKLEKGFQDFTYITIAKINEVEFFKKQK